MRKQSYKCVVLPLEIPGLSRVTVSDLASLWDENKMRTCILGTTVITGPRFSLVHPTLKFVITLNYLDLENTSRLC